MTRSTPALWQIDRYHLDGDLLCYNIDKFDAPRVVVHNDYDLRARINHELHDSPMGAHLGREKPFAAVSRDFFWPHMYNWVRKWVRTCETYHRVKPSKSSQAPLRSLPIATEAWRSVSMDFIFGLPPDAEDRTGVLVFVDGFTKLKTLREKLITQKSSESAEVERNTQPRAVGNYSSRSSFMPFGGAAGGGIRTPSPFPERRSSGRSAAPTYRGQESILTNEFENEPDLGSGSDDQRFAGQSSEFPRVRLATGAAAVGRYHEPSPAKVWDRLEAVENLQTSELAEIRQELKLLRARVGQAGHTASNVHVSLGTVVARVEQRASVLEARIAPSHWE
ncbi:hypothetical protein PR002_g28798 [Phytophthora rubi]|uniref:Integrase zinc-binding domain-containing protein n=1 Tax=Phytophthora rubi TaxID=129364 RepID=A0A6A3H7N9_9STRA|nr:hypothetical protein PR002_g28798 [Phytophthora rubi]